MRSPPRLPNKRPEFTMERFSSLTASSRALPGVMKPLTPQGRLWYHRTFTLPGGWLAGVFCCISKRWTGKLTRFTLTARTFGSHRGGYDAFTFDVTGALKGEGRQELVVSDLDPTDTGWQLRGKQVLHPIGCSCTASSGIWQTVWLGAGPHRQSGRPQGCARCNPGCSI